MPLTLTWFTALILIADRILLGAGWIVANALYSALLWVLQRGKAS